MSSKYFCSGHVESDMDRLDVRLCKHEETRRTETAFIIWININGTSFEYLSSSKNGNDAYASITLMDMYDVMIDQLINAYTDNT